MRSDMKAYYYLMAHAHSLYEHDYDPENPDTLRERLGVASEGERVMIEWALGLCRRADETEVTAADIHTLDAGNLRALVVALSILAQHEEVTWALREKADAAGPSDRFRADAKELELEELQLDLERSIGEVHWLRERISRLEEEMLPPQPISPD